MPAEDFREKSGNKLGITIHWGFFISFVLYQTTQCAATEIHCVCFKSLWI